MDVIKTAKLTKYYGKARGIVDLDLTVSQGEFFGFIGPNGAGKSTTIRTLLGLIAPTSGSAMICGKDVTKEKEAILRRIGYLPSEALFYQGMKVKDILRLSADLRKTDCSAEAERLCERLQLDTSRKKDRGAVLWQQKEGGHRLCFAASAGAAGAGRADGRTRSADAKRVF